jgi:hypothetical protein
MGTTHSEIEGFKPFVFKEFGNEMIVGSGRT